MKLFAPIIICSLLLACSSSPSNKLLEDTQVTLKKAATLHASASCEDQFTAAQMLTQLDDKLSAIDKKPNLDGLTVEQLQLQTLDTYNDYVRESYYNSCCWAIELIVQCADNNRSLLTAAHRRNLKQVKAFYTTNCCQGRAQTAMM